MTPIQLNIILQAVKIRISKGEDATAALDKYPKLTQSDREYILSELSKEV